MPPHLTIIDNTHRAIIADTAPEHAQVEEYEPRLWTTDELLWAMFFSGVGGALITVGLAFVWSLYL